MFPALPTGMARTSGARPRASQISKAPVFCPSILNGFTEFTSVNRSRGAASRTMRRASSKEPSTGTTRAPCAIACTSFPTAIPPAGTTTKHCIPARLAYAAAAAAVFPVLAHRTARLPSSSAFDIARVIPRSLNDPVGFCPSYFRCRSTPGMCRMRRGARRSGVAPSRSVTSGVRGVTGRYGRYSSITPRQALLAIDHPNHVAHRADDVERLDAGQDAPHPALQRRVGDHDDVRGLAPALLHDRADADALLPEDRGDAGEHAGTIRHLHEEVERRGRLLHGPEGIPAEGAHADPPVDARPAVPRHIDQVSHDRAGGGSAAGAPAGEHHLADRIAPDEDGVELVPDRGEGVGPGQQRRVDARLDPSTVLPGDRQEFDHHSQLLGESNVLGRDPADAFPVHLI